ncbi:hypothetical protein D0A34_13130 [Microcoleus vaginatus PCC 9802]|uniref:hypothetical protein n=1 Tax=Microcoleus vaginatus TaxID=119532 RepID=UPI00020D108F|nr:hypothetical protein MicvaDRAFT_4329 [Microcoleus vaginatus FGP-2]UNU19689.1 hypothetical protein D0A34_13130 [Microcoleus vaginatus PCC 9802]
MKWLVLLDVKKSDFDNLSNLLRSSDEFSLMAENGEYYLTSSRWESLTNTSDVYGEATKPLQDISAIARIHFTGFPLLKPDIICEVDEEGKRQRWVALSATISVDSSSFSIQLEGGQDIIRNLEFESWRKLAEEDEIVKNVFRQITDFEHKWINLYKVYEIVNKDAGKKKIEQWITKDKISQFTHTANSQSAIGDDARHGVDKHAPPKEPMSLYEADALIMALLQKWLQWKCEQQK